MNEQRGSVSILIIAFVMMAMLLTLGILAVAESKMAQQQLQYATQASANAGAYVYGRTYNKELNRCIKEKIEEELEGLDVTEGEPVADSESESEPSESTDSEESSSESCTPAKLQQCVDTDFKECEIDLNSCWDEDESPIEACQEDGQVRQVAADAANSSAHHLADENKLTNVRFNLENEMADVSAEKELETQVPHFGVSQLFASQASSKVIIRATQEQE